MEWGASPRRVLLVGAALAVLIACWVVPPHPTRPRPRWLRLPPAPTSPSPTGAAALRAQITDGLPRLLGRLRTGPPGTGSQPLGGCPHGQGSPDSERAG